MEWTTDELNCTLGYVLPWRHSGACVMTSEQVSGLVAGILGVLLWLAAHIILFIQRHQTYRCQLQSPDGACLRLVYLTIAHAFDSGGCFMSRQSGYQLLFSLYLLATDLLYMLQYFLSVWLPSRLWKKHNKSPKPRLQTLVVALPWLLTVCNLCTWLPLARGPVDTEPDHQRKLPGRILLASMNRDTEMLDIAAVIGYICGVVAMILYWAGHVPIMIRVLQERSISRHEIGYHTLSVLGNLAYVMAVLANRLDVRLVIHTLPWTVGRLGQAGLDIGILLQVWMNNRRRNRGKELDEDVVSLLKSEEEDSESVISQSESVGHFVRLTDNDALWIPLEPINNRYLRQIHRLSKYMSYQTRGEWYMADSSESEEVNTDERSRLRSQFPPRHIKPEYISDSSEVTSESENFTEDWLSHSPVLNEEEVFDILASEERNDSSSLKVKVGNLRSTGKVKDARELNPDEVYWFSEQGLPEDVAASISQLSLETSEGHAEVKTDEEVKVTLSRSPSVER